MFYLSFLRAIKNESDATSVKQEPESVKQPITAPVKPSRYRKQVESVNETKQIVECPRDIFDWLIHNAKSNYKSKSKHGTAWIVIHQAEDCLDPSEVHR